MPGIDAAGSEEEDFVVEAVLGKKTVKGKPQFLLKWRGYPASEATWCARRTFRCTAAELLSNVATAQPDITPRAAGSRRRTAPPARG